VIGPTERCWATSYTTEGESDIDAFAQALNKLLNGRTVGEAMRFFTQRYTNWMAQLGRELEQVMFRGKQRDESLLSRLGTAVLDARNWVILGDPAARLPLEPAATLVERPTIEPVSPVQRAGLVDFTPPESTDLTLLVNGINGETGEYLIAPMTPKQLSLAAQGELPDVAWIQGR
jgi:hypothetical protein